VNRYRAEEIAAMAHKDQVDLCGEPYILHPTAVAKAVRSYPDAEDIEPYVCLAWIHDVAEDTLYRIDPDELGEELILAYLSITRKKGEVYADYIWRLCDDPIASIVKLADLWHNLQPVRLECLPEAQQASLTRRYLAARNQIWLANRTEWWPEVLQGKQ